jgi:hypothetical protein
MPLDINEISPIKEKYYQEAQQNVLKFIKHYYDVYEQMADESFKKGDLVQHSAYCGAANELLKLLGAMREIDKVISGDSVIMTRKEFSNYKRKE